MQIEFLRDRARAQVGQKADAIPPIVVSAIANTDVPFGSLVLYDETDAFLCKLPVVKGPLDKPLGITLRQLYQHNYPAKASIAVMRKGRVWVDAEKAISGRRSLYQILR